MKISKTIAWMVLLVLTCVGFAACGDDDDDEASSKDYAKMIIGTWSETGEVTYPSDHNNYGFTFYSNGKYVSFGSGSWTGTYKIVDNMLILDNDYEDAQRIKSITKNMLVLDAIDWDGDEVYYRVD